MVDGPEVGLEVIAALAADKRMAQHHRLLAAGRTCVNGPGTPKWRPPTTSLRRRATSMPERCYLTVQAARLSREAGYRAAGAAEPACQVHSAGRSSRSRDGKVTARLLLMPNGPGGKYHRR